VCKCIFLAYKLSHGLFEMKTVCVQEDSILVSYTTEYMCIYFALPLFAMFEKPFNQNSTI
jgi:hypothetical protein